LAAGKSKILQVQKGLMQVFERFAQAQNLFVQAPNGTVRGQPGLRQAKAARKRALSVFVELCRSSGGRFSFA